MTLQVTGSQVTFPDQSEMNTAPKGFGFKNRIINGDMRIAQRGTSVAVPNNTSIYGGPDRWMASNQGAGGQYTQSQNTLTYNGVVKPSLRQTVNTGAVSLIAGNHWNGIQQMVEGFNAYDLNNQPISVSFIFNTNVSGTYSVAVRNGANTQSYVTTITATANTPTRYTISIPSRVALAIPNSNASGIALTIGFLNQGQFQTSYLNSWQAGNYAGATGSTNWGATAGNFIEVTEVQLEKGAVSTDFDYRPYGVEYVLCKRYYQAFTGLLISQWAGGSFGGGIVNIYGIEMRSSPTLIVANINGGGGYTGGLTGDTPNAPYNNFRVWFGVGGATAAQQHCEFLLRVSAEI